MYSSGGDAQTIINFYLSFKPQPRKFTKKIYQGLKDDRNDNERKVERMDTPSWRLYVFRPFSYYVVWLSIGFVALLADNTYGASNTRAASNRILTLPPMEGYWRKATPTSRHLLRASKAQDTEHHPGTINNAIPWMTRTKYGLERIRLPRLWDDGLPVGAGKFSGRPGVSARYHCIRGGQGRGMSGQGRSPFVPHAIRPSVSRGQMAALIDCPWHPPSAQDSPGLCFCSRFLVAGGRGTTSKTVWLSGLDCFIYLFICLLIFILCYLSIYLSVHFCV